MKKKLFLFLFFIFPYLKAPVGLANQGNTCYQNAALQTLYNVKPLTDFLISKKDTSYYLWQIHGKPTIAKVYTDLVSSLRGSKEESIAPKEFCARAWNELDFPAYAQADAQEFLNAVIERLSFVEYLQERNLLKYEFYGYPDEINFKTFVGSLFNFFLSSSLRCVVCGVTRRTIELNKLLPLPIKKIENHNLVMLKSLDECCKAFTQPEFLTGSDQIECAQCGGKQDGEKTLKLQTAPPFFIISLKRFEALITTGRVEFKKIVDPISIPLKMNFGPYFYETAFQKDFAQYELIGVVIHGGSYGGGHYWAYVKTEDGTWYNCNDSRVTALSGAEVDAWQGNFQSDGGTPYILFYRRINEIPEIMTREKLTTLLQERELLQVASLLLQQKSKSKPIPLTLDSFVKGINEGLLTFDELREQLEALAQEVSFESLKQDLLELEVSLIALEQRL